MPILAGVGASMMTLSPALTVGIIASGAPAAREEAGAGEWVEGGQRATVRFQGFYHPIEDQTDRFKLIRLTPGWGIIFGFFVIHLMLVFLIGLRFVTPYSTNATVVQRTIQLIPRLPEPTLVTDVLVEEGAPVKKGQPIFQFDRRPYE